MNLLEAVRKGNLEDVKANIDSDTWFQNTPWSDYILLNNAIQYNRFKVVKFLLEKKCRVNHTEAMVPESTPLHRAIAKKNVELVIELLNEGASVDAWDANDETPVHLAGKSRKIQIVNALMPYINSASNLVNRQGLTHLHVACMSDNLQIVSFLLSRHVDVNCAVNMSSPQKPGFTPLHFAVFNGRTEIAKVLLSAGAEPDAADANGATPLHLAFRKKNDCLVKLMLKRWSSDTIEAAVVNLVDDMKISYFHTVCSQNECAILDKYWMQGVDINDCISFKSSYLPGYTPLHVAVQFRCNNTIEWLLKHGAVITKRDKAGFTPVHQAFWRKEYDLVDLFVHEMSKVGMSENPVDTDGVSFFHISCLRDNPDVIQDFINSGLDINLRIKSGSNRLAGCTPLHVAVRFEQPGNVDVLLKNQANVYAADVKGETPLHYVCQWNGDKIEALMQIAQKIFMGNRVMDMLQDHLTKSVKIVKLFVDLGVKVDIPDKSNLTPLFHFFDHRSEVTLSNHLFFMPYSEREFHHRVKGIIKKIRVEMFKMMVKLKPNFELRGKLNSTLLHLLAERPVMHFIEDEEQYAPPMLENGENVDALNEFGETALFLAAARGNEKLVGILLEKKPNVNIFVKTHRLGTPVAAAMDFVIDCFHKPNIVNRLIKHGADVNVILKDGRTALHHIFSSGKFAEICKYMTLPVAICDLDIRERATGRTALHLATLVGDSYAVDWLLRAGADINAVDHKGFNPVMYCAQEPHMTGLAYFYYFQRLQLIGYRFPAFLLTFLAFSLEHAAKEKWNQNVEKYWEELERLKGYVINQNCRLYGFLFRSIHEMAYYVNNEKVHTLLSSPQLCEEFPQYGPLIASKYRKALARHNILKESVCSFGILTAHALPENVADKILEFLDDADVMKIITIGQNIIETADTNRAQSRRDRCMRAARKT